MECAEYGHDCADNHHAEAEHVELEATFTERAEEAGADFETKLVDKQYQAEIFGVVEYGRVD